MICGPDKCARAHIQQLMRRRFDRYKLWRIKVTRENRAPLSAWSETQRGSVAMARDNQVSGGFKYESVWLVQTADKIGPDPSGAYL